MQATRKLLELGSAPLATAQPDHRLRAQGLRTGELLELLASRNGFICFEGALHVFPSGGDELTLELWNSNETWRSEYGDLANGCLFFAQDTFGNQFAIRGDEIVTFTAETGEVEAVAGTLNDWAKCLLDDWDYLTGYSLLHEWQAMYGKLPLSHRLVGKTPFVLGGDYALPNLYQCNAIKAMRWHGALAVQLQGLPDGADVVLQPIE